jgi:SAM-dependent methyltransferase
MLSAEPYYGADLALVHHLGFGFHADNCAPGMLDLLRPVKEHGGLVVELGCGSGHLTRHLVEAGHRVMATDASPAMLELARQYVPGTDELRRLTLPDDPIPSADAIVSIGHALSYLADEDAIDRALAAACRALQPGGLLVIDLCDLEWGRARRESPPSARVEDDWAVVSRYSSPAPNRFVRDLTTFLREPDGRWRRADERHENVLIDTAHLPDRLRSFGVDARVLQSIGSYQLMPGLVAVVGRRP